MIFLSEIFVSNGQNIRLFLMHRDSIVDCAELFLQRAIQVESLVYFEIVGTPC
jgi:hypothetical protein